MSPAVRSAGSLRSRACTFRVKHGGREQFAAPARSDPKTIALSVDNSFGTSRSGSYPSLAANPAAKTAERSDQMTQKTIRELGRASKVTLGSNFGTIERDGLRIAGAGLQRR